MVEYSDIPGREWKETGLSVEAKQMLMRCAHLLNNELMIVSGNLQLLLMERPPDKHVENGIKMVLAEVGKMKEVIQELNDFSRSLETQGSDSED